MGIIDNVKKRDEEIKNSSEIRNALNAIGFVRGGDTDE
jgi:hypothetical protein